MSSLITSRNIILSNILVFLREINKIHGVPRIHLQRKENGIYVSPPLWRRNERRCPNDVSRHRFRSENCYPTPVTNAKATAGFLFGVFGIHILCQYGTWRIILLRSDIKVKFDKIIPLLIFVISNKSGYSTIHNSQKLL